ncbi:hypothetical protein OIO90_002357 [Microbotryomycetes sp. JL221]|nr:hypothetical protein OIO90_002357 [Microbotryomycetes sp. JL221]
MGLLTIIRKTRLKEKQVRVLMLGLDNAGKTTIVHKLLNKDVNKVSPTLGFSITTLVYKTFSLNIWDIGGQSTLRPYWRNYFETTDVVVWVVDSSDKARLRDTKQELENLLKQERLSGASLLVFANKQDIPGSLTAQQISEALELDKLTSHKCHVEPCSARTPSSSTTEQQDPLWTGLDWVVSEMTQRRYYGTQNPWASPIA